MYQKTFGNFYWSGKTGVHHTLFEHLISLLTFCSSKHKSPEWMATTMASLAEARNLWQWAPNVNLYGCFYSIVFSHRQGKSSTQPEWQREFPTDP